MYVLINPQLYDAPDAEKCSILEQVYIVSRGGRAEALQYLEYCQQAFHPDSVQMGSVLVEHTWLVQWLDSDAPDCCSSNALRETFDAKLSNLITSRCFTILRGPIIFDLHVQGIPGTFISRSEERRVGKECSS